MNRTKTYYGALLILAIVFVVGYCVAKAGDTIADGPDPLSFKQQFNKTTK